MPAVPSGARPVSTVGSPVGWKRQAVPGGVWVGSVTGANRPTTNPGDEVSPSGWGFGLMRLAS